MHPAVAILEIFADLCFCKGIELQLFFSLLHTLQTKHFFHKSVVKKTVQLHLRRRPQDLASCRAAFRSQLSKHPAAL